jgi:hypothetical protein
MTEQVVSALETEIASVFQNVGPRMKMKDLRAMVRGAVLRVAKAVDEDTSKYLAQHAACFCREVFSSYNGQQIVQDPDQIKDNALASLQITFKKVYNGS